MERADRMDGSDKTFIIIFGCTAAGILILFFVACVVVTCGQRLCCQPRQRVRLQSLPVPMTPAAATIWDESEKYPDVDGLV